MAIHTTTVIEHLRDIGIIHRKPVKLRSGKVANFYCDIKKAYGYPDILNALADAIGKKLKKSETCIAASGYGGLPLGAVVASRFCRKLVAVRDTEKKHGKRGLIDGYFPTKKDRVVIVDDVLTTGSSIKATLKVLTKARIKVSRAIVVVQRAKAKLPISYDFLYAVEGIL